MRLFVLLMLVVGAGCASAQALKAPVLEEYDLWGHKYPVECQGDLSDVKLRIMIVPQSDMRVGYIGECVGCNTSNDAFIMISDVLVDERRGPKWRTEAIKHEKCHRKMWQLGLNPYWHAG